MFSFDPARQGVSLTLSLIHLVSGFSVYFYQSASGRSNVARLMKRDRGTRARGFGETGKNWGFIY